MSDETRANAEGVDFAMVAYREEGVWQVEQLPDDAAADLDRFVEELQRWPGDGGALGMVSVDEDFFLLVRVLGPLTKILISDVSAATEWPIAKSALEYLDLPIPEDESEQVPGGDVDILADLGLGAMDMAVLLDDYELYPDEMLGEVAEKLGFGRRFDEALGVPAG